MNRCALALANARIVPWSVREEGEARAIDVGTEIPFRVDGSPARWRSARARLQGVGGRAPARHRRDYLLKP